MDAVEEDYQLIEKIKETSCSDSFEKLVSRHENLYYKICHKYSASLTKSGINIQDVLSEKNIVFFNSLNSFNFEKNTKFSTWLANQARFFCLSKIFSNKNKLNVDNQETIDMIDSEVSFKVYNEAENKINLESLINYTKEYPDKRIYYIFNRKYSDNKVKWKHIAEELGVTTQTVLNLHKKGINLLKKKIKLNKIEIYE